MVNQDRWGIVLDMDDTLYLERDYVRSGFDAVAARLGRAGLDEPTVSGFLWDRFVAGHRGDHFDELLAAHGPVPREAGSRSQLVADLVTTYREHVPAIRLLPGVADLVSGLRAAGHRLAVISDGALASQQAKVAALGVGDLVGGPVLLTDAWGREFWKPHTRAFEEAQGLLGLPVERLVYVGDNPAKDFDAPRSLGWWCVRLRLPGQLHHDVEDAVAPDLTVTSIRALAAALDDMTRGGRDPGP